MNSSDESTSVDALGMIPVWDRPRPRLRRTGLTRERIVAASITLADADGLESLSMRDIARTLGSSPMSLYRHVLGKEDLIDLMMDAIVGEQDLRPVPTGKWTSDLHRMGEAHRECLLIHPWATGPHVRPLLGPEALRRFEVALSAFPDAVPISRRAWAVNTVDAFVRGSVSAELAERLEIERTGVDKRQWQEAMEPYMIRMLATGRYPHVDRYTREDSSDPAEQFRMGLDAVLSGISDSIED